MVPCSYSYHFFCDLEVCSSSIEKNYHHFRATFPVPYSCSYHFFCDLDVCSSSVEKEFHHFLIKALCYYSYCFFCNLDVCSAFYVIKTTFPRLNPPYSAGFTEYSLLPNIEQYYIIDNKDPLIYIALGTTRRRGSKKALAIRNRSINAYRIRPKV